MRLLVDMRATDGLYRRQRVRVWQDGFGIRHSVESGERGTEFITSVMLHLLGLKWQAKYQNRPSRKSSTTKAI